MRRGLNHDEYHFPSFHVPGLSLIYALLFQFSSQLLLSARLFSVVCGWLLVVLLWGMTFVALHRERPLTKMAAATGVALLLIGAPLFFYTSGRAWNHDLPMLLTVAAFGLVTRRWVDGGGSPRVINPRRTAKTRLSELVVAGVLVGLATATRLSFAFAFLAFALAILIQPASHWTERRKRWIQFCLGGVLGAMPALGFLLWSPQEFLFGNLTYIGLNTQYYQSLATPPVSMTWSGKLIFLGGLLGREPANLLPILCFLLVGLWLWRSTRYGFTRNGVAPGIIFREGPPARPDDLPQPSRKMSVPTSGVPYASSHSLNTWHWQLWALLAASMFASALVATPSQAQYFYPLWPLLILGLVLLLADASQRTGLKQTLPLPLLLLLAAGAVALFLSRSPYWEGIQIVFSPREWYPTKLHARGQWLSTLVKAGGGQSNAVLTVAPILPLEGGVAIYPELATGPFAWRVAPLLDAESRRRYQLFSPDELKAQLTATPPRALLVGLENDDAELEESLLAWAQPRGYVPIAMPDEGTLWVAPLAEWGGAIRLGAHTVPPVLRSSFTCRRSSRYPRISTVSFGWSAPMGRSIGVLRVGRGDQRQRTGRWGRSGPMGIR